MLGYGRDVAEADYAIALPNELAPKPGTLDHVQRAGAALLTDRPTLGARDLPVILWRAARWPS